MHDVIHSYCEYCPFQARGLSNLNKHRNKDHGCKEENNGLTKVQRFEHIYLQDIEQSKEGFLCKKCGFHSKWKKSIKTHIQTKHQGVRHFCEKCEFNAKLLKDVKSHIKYEHEGVRYKCANCDYEAKLKQHLTRHNKIH